ncbi:MAG: LLM class F420-dependent oxidoreductase [Chloroflexota bacterium]
MRVGSILPHMGMATTPAAIVRAAQQAEALDYSSLWVAERLLFPVKPKTPYPGTPDGSLPDFYQQAFEPVETLTFVAAHTKRIRVGTSVLNMPFHNPALLSKRLATLDAFSGGRLNVGLGQGWSQDEMEAAGAPTTGIAGRADEFVQALRAMWGPDPVSFQGKYFNVAPSIVNPKPVQQLPPIYLAAYAPSALARVARYADGWLPTGIPLAGVGPMMAEIRRQAGEAGRDPAALKLIVLGHVTLTDSPLGAGRADFTGTLDEIRRDVEATRALGADELVLNPGATPGTETEDGFLRVQEQLRPLG